MSTDDEEPYSTIFASLKHPIRRRILRMLSKQPMSFMEMIEVLGVSNSFLTYHLENLGELIGKTEDGKYKLSNFGEAANATMTKVEDIPAGAAHQSSETTPKRVVGRSVAIALAMMCIVLVAGTGGAMIYYTSVANDKDKTISSQNSQISSLGNQKNQLQTWLDGNETLLNQTQLNNTYLQEQIDLLNSNVTNLQNQVNNFQIGSADNSTIWVNNRIVNATEGVRVPDFVALDWLIVSGGQLISTGLAYNKTYVNASAGYWAIHVPSAGYVSIRVSSNNTSTYVGLGTFYPWNDTLFDSLNDNSTLLLVLTHNIGITHPTNNMFIAPTYDEFSVGFGGTVVFPVLPTSWMGILVGSTIDDATATVTITYYY